MVYFIALENTSYVKIGFSQDLKSLNRRITKIQSDNPHGVQILWVCEGDRKLESFYHVYFRKWHVRGDWFEDSQEIREFLQNQPGLEKFSGD